MKRATLIRQADSDQGTPGTLSIGDWSCFTLELPWKDNKPKISRIPEGDYIVAPWNSRKFPNTYHVRAVPGRNAILLHTGNLAGDKARGFKTHVLGCVLVGKRRGWIGKQRAILQSAIAMNELRQVAGRDSFLLSIRRAHGNS